VHTAVVVSGPTGSGKSDLSLDLAQCFNGEIVNCDSVQLYRYMDIGTAKTPLAERKNIPHHLIDILNPDEIFTAGEYQRAARATLDEIASRGRVPVIVGGTGFYLQALLEGLFEGPPRNDELRARLARRKPGSIHRLLTRFDPAAASHIHSHDMPKLIRALEVCLLTHHPITSLHQHNREPLKGFRIVQVGLDPPRDQLADRINERCVRMFTAGLVAEVEQILAMGFPRDAKALQSIGYRESLQYLDGGLSMMEALERTQAATRQYAKRQRTWFRRDASIVWFHAFGNDGATSEAIKCHVASAINS
jgi:tRNA dimethylallyltransferase